MAKYALFLNHTAERYEGLDQVEYMDIIKDYIAWVQTRAAEGVYVGGHKLKTAEARYLTASGDGIEVHDSPSAEVAEVLGGIMIIKADNFDAAVEIAKGHPHFVHNRQMQIWQLDESVE